MYVSKLDIIQGRITHRVALTDVVYLFAQRQYTEIWVMQNDKLVRQMQPYNIGKYKELLVYGFIRPRNNYIVNSQYITSFSCTDRVLYINQSKELKIQVPKANWAAVMQALQQTSFNPLGK